MGMSPSAKLVFGIYIADDDNGFVEGVREALGLPEDYWKYDDLSGVLETQAEELGFEVTITYSYDWSGYVFSVGEDIMAFDGNKGFDSLPEISDEDRSNMKAFTEKVNTYRREHNVSEMLKPQWQLIAFYG